MKHFILFISIVLMGVIYGNGVLQELSSSNPGWKVNPQDVPIFFEDTPLTGLKTFIVYPPAFEKTQLQVQIKELIEKKLGAIGKIIKFEEKDITGFGAESALVMQVKNICNEKGGELPITRSSLYVQTSVAIKRTKINTRPIVWQLNEFSNNYNNNEKDVLLAVDKLLSEFVENYQYVNSAENIKPLFYFYE